MDFDLSPEQEELRERAWKLGAAWKGRQPQFDREDTAPYDEVIEDLRNAKLLGLTVDPELGGQGLTCMDYVIVFEALLRSSQCWILGEPLFSTTGPGPSMLALAEPATQKKFLPDIVAGRKGCAIALTEPLHGSDLTHLETIARFDGDEIVVTGEKRFITGAPHNELYAVFARFDDVPGAAGIGCVIVPKGTPGLDLRKGAEFVGARGYPHGEVSLHECRVPKENLVRGPGTFRELMTAFNMERLHNSIYSLALMEAAWDETVDYVENRRAFGRDVIEFQSTYHLLAEMHVKIEAQRLLIYKAAVTAIDGKFPRPLESTVSKLFGAVEAPILTMDGLMLHGGDGGTMAYPIQSLHRDAVVCLACGGTPPILKNAIASQLFPHRRFSQTPS